MKGALVGAKKLLEFRDASRRYSNTEPWKSFVPERIVRLTAAPPNTPNSAVGLLVWTLNSWMASSGGVMLIIAFSGSLLTTPSSR